MSRVHDTLAELEWVERERDQWRKCAHDLHEALMYFAREELRLTDENGWHGFSSEKNAVRFFEMLGRAYPQESRP